MSVAGLSQDPNLDASAEQIPTVPASESSVLAYLHIHPGSERVVPHAIAVAKAFATTPTLCHVVDTPAGRAPADPVDLSIRSREAERHLHRLRKKLGLTSDDAQCAVHQGKPHDRVRRWMRENEGTVVLATENREDDWGWQVDDMARALIEHGSGNLLLVPGSTGDTGVAEYRRIVLPLDGSCWAESILPMAIRMARSWGSELVLVHAVPSPEVTEIGPLGEEDVALARKLTERNERVAREYLDRIAQRISEAGVQVNQIISKNGDVRKLLVKLARQEKADLIMMTSHGKSAATDNYCGMVVAYMMSHTPAPLLIAMRNAKPGRRLASRGSIAAARPPSFSVQ